MKDGLYTQEEIDEEARLGSRHPCTRCGKEVHLWEGGDRVIRGEDKFFCEECCQEIDKKIWDWKNGFS